MPDKQNCTLPAFVEQQTRLRLIPHRHRRVERTKALRRPVAIPLLHRGCMCDGRSQAGSRRVTAKTLYARHAAAICAAVHDRYQSIPFGQNLKSSTARFQFFLHQKTSLRLSHLLGTLGKHGTDSQLRWFGESIGWSQTLSSGASAIPCSCTLASSRRHLTLTRARLGTLGVHGRDSQLGA